MDFSKSIEEIIKERTSWRTYKPEELNSEIRGKLDEILKLKGINSPFGGKCRFEIISMPEFDLEEKQNLGTYGFIKGVQDFIVGAAEESEYSRENYGYLLESIILKCTDMGLGTCWLGGTYNRKVFSKKFGIENKEIMPAITPVGVPKNRRIRERVIRGAIRGNRRKPWSNTFFLGDGATPLSEDAAGKYHLLLEMVRWGPSASNRQPWRIIKEKDANIFHFYIISGQGLFGGNYDNMRRLDIAIAVCHFDLTAKEKGFQGQWVFKDPELEGTQDLMYKITWKEQ